MLIHNRSFSLKPKTLQIAHKTDRLLFRVCAPSVTQQRDGERQPWLESGLLALGPGISEY